MKFSSKRDVIVVGAGAAGLTAALHLSNQDLSVTVVDGAVHPGAENWSGCVFFGENLANPEVLGPNWQDEVAVERKLVSRGVYMTNGVDTGGIRYKNENTFQNCATVLRPVFDHDLGQIARNKGIQILSRTTALGLIRENDKVIGVSTAKGPLYADLVFLAEGDASHLVSKEGYSNLPHGDKGHYLQGIKEVIHLPQEVINERFEVKSDEGVAYEMIIRNARIGGKTVQLNMGAFIYTNRESLSIGLVLPLDNLAQYFKGSHNTLMEWFKSLPVMQKWIKGGERTAYGAKIINANGYKHVAQLCDDGLAIGGACTGIGLDFPYPNYTGPASFTGLCLGRAVKKIKSEKLDFTKENLAKYYESEVKGSQYYKDMKVTQNWADYIAKTKSFFSLFTDINLDCAHPFFEKDRSFLSGFKEANRSFLYHAQGKFGTLIKDLKVQQASAGATGISPFGIIKGLFSTPSLPVDLGGELRLEVFHKDENVTENINPLVKKAYSSSEEMIKGAFNTLYINDGSPLIKRFETLNCILAKKGFLLGLTALLASPIFITLGILFGIFDLFKDKKKLMQTDTAKRVMDARKAQEISSFTAPVSVEDKLSTIVYETDKESHIKVHWPMDKFLPESDPNSALWHICPAGVYTAKSDPAGMLRPVVDYENCVKCESCWRGSPLADWGRRDSHRLIYRVKTTANTALFRHIDQDKKDPKELGNSQYDSPIHASIKAQEVIQNINDDISRIHNLIHSTERTLDASERQWIKKILKNVNNEANKLNTHYEGDRANALLTLLSKSILKVTEHIKIERFFWADAELLTLQQHCLTQLGHSPNLSEVLIPEHSSLELKDEAIGRFNHAHIHHIKEHGLEADDKNLLLTWLNDANERTIKELLQTFAKIDLSITSSLLLGYLGRVLSKEKRTVVVADGLTKNEDGTVTGSIPFVLSSLDKNWLIVSEAGSWLLDPENDGVTLSPIGTIGLRSTKPQKVTLDKASLVKINTSLEDLHKLGTPLFLHSVISAGEYLLEKSLDHGTGRIQFPDLFQDEHGRDGIIKFGAVKALISHISCRLELLKIASSNESISIPEIYTQAGKWLGTQEGSFTYNASQVFGGTGFSEDDTLSPYYRDASIFKYILGDPLKVQSAFSPNDFNYTVNDFPTDSLIEELNENLQKALSEDRKIKEEYKDLTFRAEMDFNFISAALKDFIKSKDSGKELLLKTQILKLAVNIYLNSAINRELDSRNREKHIECGKQLVSSNWRENSIEDRKFTYEEFLEKIPPQPTGNYLLQADFDIPRYSPENLQAEERLRELGKTLNNDFKEYFIDKDFDGMSYVRYAEAKHGHSDEVIKMFHDKGYMKLIIPSELGGGGTHKAEYYLLISASMQYGDPALSLIIQASTSIGTSPMLLAWKKDIPRAMKETTQLIEEKNNLKQWVEDCKELKELVAIPDPKAIKLKFKDMGDGVKALAKTNSVFKSYCGGFLYDLHKAGQAGISFQLEDMGNLLQSAGHKLEGFIPKIDELAENFKLRKNGVGFFLSLIASGQTSAFALTEPSAGSDTARVATRAEIKEVEVTLTDNLHTFTIDGEQKTLITLEQTRFHEGQLQIRLAESDAWSDVIYDKYSWADDTGYRYFRRGDEEVAFHDFGNVEQKDNKLIYTYYELTGSKMWITNGRFAGLFALYAKTKEGVTGFCVDRYTDGLTIGKDEDKMGQNASPTNEVFLSKVRVSKDFVLGIEGRGQVNALETLNVGRAGLSLSSLALSEDVLDAAIKMAQDKPEHFALLGKMSEEVFGGFGSAYEMIGIFDKPGSDARMESAIGKFMNSEILHRVILYSESIHGSCAQTYDHDVEKKKRDARILNIYEGTNEIQRFLIIKDLIEQVSKKEATPKATSSTTNQFIEKWDEHRLNLLKVLKQVHLDLGSKAWIDAQLQPVFFTLAEIAGWLKYSEGAIWRLNDISSNNELLTTSLECSIERSFSEISRRFTLFKTTYSELSQGIRPPEITICSLLLDEDETTDDSNKLQSHALVDHDVTAFLTVKPLNKPEPTILDGKLLETTAVLTSGSENILNSLSSINGNKKIVIAAPATAEELILHLSSYANIEWVETGDQWPNAHSLATLWNQVATNESTLLFDSSTSESLALANFTCLQKAIESYDTKDFTLLNENILVLNDSGQTKVSKNSALLINSPLKARALTKAITGSINKTTGTLTTPLEVQLPPEPPKTESICIESPENAASFIKQSLGLEGDSANYELQETTLEDTSKFILVGSVKDEEISRDTLAALQILADISNDLTLVLLGAESFNIDKLQKLAILPQKILVLEFPENWLTNSNVVNFILNEQLGDTSSKQLFFASSRSASAGRVSAQQKLDLYPAISKLRQRQNDFIITSYAAEDTIVEQFEENKPFIGILSATSARNEQNRNSTAEVSRVKVSEPQNELMETIKLLNESVQNTGVESISDANFIIDIGYGIGNQDNYDEFITPLTNTLKEMGVKFTIGASRKLVETLKILPAEAQIGQSGSSVAPTILIAVGISGAPQHVNYIGKNTSILCFNIDDKAPLMILNETQPFPKVYPLVGNLKKTLPMLTEALKSFALK
ncbi:MAG: acyl-CoA dehydrogenase family protein [Lentisphaeraceae bacterium]|nr:acyl-CoA dehydrogenase family protein [Lentisphaeraceae bacterium]